MKSDICHIGVDVSKGKLDIYTPAKKEGPRLLTKEVDNNLAGFWELRASQEARELKHRVQR